MTAEDIDVRKERAALKFDVAKQIRQLLDAAQEKYGDEWDADGIEAEILELVTEDA